MRTKKQKVLLFLKCFAVFIALSFVLLFVFRNALLQKAITKIESKLATDYATKLTIEKAKFDGISGIELQNINVVPNQADTLLSVEKIKTKIEYIISNKEISEEIPLEHSIKKWEQFLPVLHTLIIQPPINITQEFNLSFILVFIYTEKITFKNKISEFF